MGILDKIKTDTREHDEYSKSDIDDSTRAIQSSFESTMEIIDDMNNRGTKPIIDEIELLIDELRSACDRSNEGYGDRYVNHVYAVNDLLKSRLITRHGRRESEIDHGGLFTDSINIVRDIADALENNKVNIAKQLAKQKANEGVNLVREGLKIFARAIITVTAGEVFTTALDVATPVVKDSIGFLRELLKKMDRASELTCS